MKIKWSCDPENGWAIAEFRGLFEYYKLPEYVEKSTLKRMIETMTRNMHRQVQARMAVERLRHAVASHDRYEVQTKRLGECIAIHPEDAKLILELLK